jgi:hypothetical protein
MEGDQMNRSILARASASRPRAVIVRLTVAAALCSAASAMARPPAAPGNPLALAPPQSFAAAVGAIERATGVRGEAIEGAAADIPLAQGRAFAVDSRTAERLVAGSHRTFRDAGLYLFRYERSYGLAGDKDRVAILATADRAAVLRRIGTSGPGAGRTTEDIIAWLDALSKDEPFELSEVGTDYVAGHFERTPADPNAVARRCAELAPDLVRGHASTIDLLAEEIRSNRTLYLLW